MERVLLTDRQAHMNRALAVGAEEYEPIDVAAELDDWIRRLGLDPADTSDARAEQRAAELMAQVV